MLSCRLCAHQGAHKHLTVKEMMFGTREAFDYFQCSACGTLQITQIPPADVLAQHYPSDYYSFEGGFKGYGTPLKTFLLTQRDRAAVGDTMLIGSLMIRARPAKGTIRICQQIGINQSHRILDVGCGNGSLLDHLAYLGFQHLTGVDPFITADLITPHGAKVFKRYVSDVSERFDVVMFHHSLEHVPNPLDSLQGARRLLNPGGVCLVRIPTCSSEAFDLYGPNWVQLDAPRHIVIPSREGMKVAADHSGFVLEQVIDDSTALQFWGSEQYRQGISLSRDPRSYAVDKTAMPPEQIAALNRKAEELNNRHRGDQAAFILRAT
ncbi:class I SAM-dependent methyltransferase [Microvirga sp. HBU67558]|uniref:class I SAM-dependent methyltransferase n=1 Tax=Microvirga TaxID=186650 RepID=UPI001B3866B0|nr:MULTISPECIES: class I SAM-dependent methyltransferase [unclassified Microvirga]MBQ0820185.1 class I SAM-dependent methyltransferase [Microvirga sp. HBU67558]